MPDLHPSARKHYRRDRLDDSAVFYAAAHVLHSRPLDDEDDPRRWLMVGTDPAGRLLELVALVFDDGYELIIHAMKARPQYLDESDSETGPPAPLPRPQQVDQEILAARFQLTTVPTA